LGLSVTHEKVNLRLEDTGIAHYEFVYKKVPRIRLGGDLSFNVNQFSFEGEYIAAKYGDISEIRIDGVISKDNPGEISYDAKFYYGTFGYQFTEQIFAYTSYWNVKHDFPFIASQIPRLLTTIGATIIDGPTVGISFKLTDRLNFKGQYGLIKIKDELPFPFSDEVASIENRYNIFAIAASVFF
jgi:hypothetical protein